MPRLRPALSSARRAPNIFRLPAVASDGTTAYSDVQVTFLDSLTVTVVLSDVPISQDPGRSAHEEMTITVTNPDGTAAAGARVSVSTIPHT